MSEVFSRDVFLFTPMVVLSMSMVVLHARVKRRYPGTWFAGFGVCVRLEDHSSSVDDHRDSYRKARRRCPRKLIAGFSVFCLRGYGGVHARGGIAFFMPVSNGNTEVLLGLLLDSSVRVFVFKAMAVSMPMVVHVCQTAARGGVLVCC